MIFSQVTTVNLLLIGFGPHARRIYYPLLSLWKDDPNLNLCAAIDIESARGEIEQYLRDRPLQPEMRYVTETQGETLSENITTPLNELVQRHNINGVIIATEPLVHLAYARWALDAGLSILMDKPISCYLNVSTDITQAFKIVADYEELNARYQRKRRENTHQVFSLMAQRRYQTSFMLIKSRIAECFSATQCPVTNVQTFHSDGQWRMPTEIVEQHYHPYNQGYGKCSHSGYHYFDILTYLLDAGQGGEKYYDSVDVFATATRPTDLFAQFTLDDYRQLFGDEVFNQYNQYSEEQLKSVTKAYGEVDCSSLLMFKRGTSILTTASVNLSHNGYSQRNWVTAAGRDLYKGNGRVSHESHIIQQGPFQSIHFHSFKSDEPGSSSLVGTKRHLEIYVFRNHKMLGGKHVEVFNLEDILKLEDGLTGLEGKSKARAFKEFIAGVRGEILPADMVSDFSKHETSARLMCGVYQSLCRHYQGGEPFTHLVLSRMKHPAPHRTQIVL